MPTFWLTLTNVSDHACRILDADRRPDLKDAYYHLVVTQDGRPVRVTRAISDPGPISDEDWIGIPSGGMKTFVLASFPDQFEELRPSVYEAHVEFWRDPDQSHDTAHESSRARFTVFK